MTALILLLAIIALVSAIGAARQATRTLRAWQLALEAVTPKQTTSDCPCTCHPLPPRRHA
jgi:hypothetical protein